MTDRQPKQGEFPFPILDGAKESKYVTWIRNNSSYLKLGGLLGGLQAVATYVRGVIGIFAFLAPFLMLIGFALGLSHFWMIAHPFVITKSLTAIAFVCMFGYFAIRVGDSRFAPPRSFAGTILGLLGGIFLLELSPHLIEYGRDSLSLRFGFQEFTTVIFGLASTAGLIFKYLPETGKFRTGLLVAVLSAISLLLTWFVVLQFENYWAYGLPPHDFYILVPAMLVGFLCILSGLFIWSSVAFPKFLKFILILALMFGLFAVWNYKGEIITRKIVNEAEMAGDQIGTLTRPLKRLVVGLSNSNNALPGDLKGKLDILSESVDVLDQQSSWIASQSGEGGRYFYELAFPDRSSETPFRPAYFQNAATFVEQSEILAKLGDVDKGRLLQLLANNSRASLAHYLKFEGEEFETAVVQAYANRIVFEKVSATEQWKQLEFDWRSLEIPEESPISIDKLVDLLNTIRIPISQAELFLSLTNREEEFGKYKDKAAPDSALSGPAILRERLNWRRDKARTIYQRSLANAISRHPNTRLASGELNFGKLTNTKDFRSTLGQVEVNRLILLNFARGLPFELLCRIAIEDEPLARSKEIWRGLKLLRRSLTEPEREQVKGRDFQLLKSAARTVLSEIALSSPAVGSEKSIGDNTTIKADRTPSEDVNTQASAANKISHQEKQRRATLLLADLYKPEVPSAFNIVTKEGESANNLALSLYRQPPGKPFSEDELRRLLENSFVFENKFTADRLLRRMVFARYAQLDNIESLPRQLYSLGRESKGWLVAPSVLMLLVICYVFMDANSTSLHDFYRDRLANAFLTGNGTSEKRPVVPDAKVKLSQLCDYKTSNSVSPYHLINAVINMQGSGVESLRDRNADFFLFSKLYVGGEFTQYLPTPKFEELSPEFNVASAMAVSGAAASPNMGKYTNGLLTFLMTVLNVRLGYWIPNPYKMPEQTVQFEQLFKDEIKQIALRRRNLKSDIPANELRPIKSQDAPAVTNELLGIALSGGGIRSAALNLGILQAIHDVGLFHEVDYLSSVSGGGYTGTAITNFMRNGASDPQETGRPTSMNAFRRFVAEPMKVVKSFIQRLIVEPAHAIFKTIYQRFFWMPKSTLLSKEMFSKINHKKRFINVSDGGHVENLGVFALLERRCKIIIVGDGEADPEDVKDGLSAVIRIADLDRNIRIVFGDGELEIGDGSERKVNSKEDSTEEIILAERTEPKAEASNKTETDMKSNSGNSALSNDQNSACSAKAKKHFAVGKIVYPVTDHNPIEETGYLLYLKSSLIGDEDQVIKNYKSVNAAFPHESTADQMFGEGQFEAYRRLGFKIGCSSLQQLVGLNDAIDYAKLRTELQAYLSS